MKNGHVNFSPDKHLCSVPFTFIGKQVRIVYTSDVVTIYRNYEPIAQQTRNYRRLSYTTDKNHLASNHRFVSEWNPEFFTTKAAAYGTNVAQYVERLMESKAAP
jgi:hypothetical protein